MTVRYVIRTVDEDWIDLVDEPVRIDDRRAAWEETRRRVAADPGLRTVVIDRDTGSVLWQSNPDIEPRYRVVTANRTWVYAIDDTDFPFDLLSVHKECDEAWTAFFAAIAEPVDDDPVFLFDTASGQKILASSDDYDHPVPAPVGA